MSKKSEQFFPFILTPYEASLFVNKSLAWIYRKIKEGSLATEQVDGEMMIRVDDLLLWAKQIGFGDRLAYTRIIEIKPREHRKREIRKERIKFYDSENDEFEMQEILREAKEFEQELELDIKETEKLIEQLKLNLEEVVLRKRKK